MKKYINLLLLVICMELILPLPLYSDAARGVGIDPFRPLIFLVGLILVSLLVTLMLRVRVHEKTDELQRLNQELRKQIADLKTVSRPINKTVRPESICQAAQFAREQEELLETLKSSVNSLTALNDEITAGSKIEDKTDQLETVPFSLRNCLESTLVHFTKAAQAGGLKMIARIDDNVPDSLVGDPGRLRQIVVCLLAHALKFTGQGHIAFSVQTQSAESDRACLQFTVSDTGQGISSPISKTLDPSSSPWLELSLATQLVRRMEGQIRIQCPSPLTADAAGGPGSALHVTLGFPLCKKTIHPIS